MYDEEDPDWTSLMLYQNNYGSFATWSGAGCASYSYASSGDLTGLYVVNDSIWHVAQQVRHVKLGICADYATAQLLRWPV